MTKKSIIQPYMDAQQGVLNAKYNYEVAKTAYDTRTANQFAQQTRESFADEIYNMDNRVDPTSGVGNTANQTKASLDAARSAAASQASGNQHDVYAETAFRIKRQRLQTLQNLTNRTNAKDIMELYKAFATDDPEQDLIKYELEAQRMADAARIAASGSYSQQGLRNQGELDVQKASDEAKAQREFNEAHGLPPPVSTSSGGTLTPQMNKIKPGLVQQAARF